MQFRIAHFDDLTAREVYDMLRLRAEVFVVEQECAYLDPDGDDLRATHLLASEGGALCGYARWYEEDGALRIGRVVTHPSRRGEGLGHDVMRACLAYVGDAEAFLHSQVYVQAFYAEHGFAPEGETFLEDDIPHVLMRRRGK